jgi:hypothetical protein
MSSQTRTIIISNITVSIFNYLHLKYGQALSCPCSADTISYNKFVSHAIVVDPVCSSIFISEQWVQALYMTDASHYISMDFRKTASSQVSKDLSEKAKGTDP